MGYRVVKVGRNPEGTITLEVEIQTWNESTGGMDHEPVGAVSLSPAEWASAMPDINQMINEIG